MDQGLGLLLQRPVTLEFSSLMLMGQKIKFKLFLHLLELQQIQLCFIAGFLQLLLKSVMTGIRSLCHTAIMKSPAQQSLAATSNPARSATTETSDQRLRAPNFP